MALIVLEEDTVSDVWLPIQPTNFTIAPLVGVAGYPSDKPGQLWFSSGKIYPQPEGWVYHDADTKSGNSGSTMWFAKNGLSVVQHVHNGYIALSGLNYGTSITADRYEWLCFLMKQTSAGVDICSLPPAGRDKST